MIEMLMLSVLSVDKACRRSQQTTYGSPNETFDAAETRTEQEQVRIWRLKLLAL